MPQSESEDLFNTPMVSMLGKVQADITEIYSPPRVSEEGTKHKLVPGLACDLTNGWDFRIARHRDLVRQHVKTAKPMLVIGVRCEPWLAHYRTCQVGQGRSRGVGKKQSSISHSL